MTGVITFSSNHFAAVENTAFTVSQFLINKTIAAIRAITPITIHVIGLASSATVNDHVAVIADQIAGIIFKNPAFNRLSDLTNPEPIKLAKVLILASPLPPSHLRPLRPFPLRKLNALPKLSLLIPLKISEIPFIPLPTMPPALKTKNAVPRALAHDIRESLLSIIH